MDADQAPPAPRKRYQILAGDRDAQGHKLLSMVERVPDPARPNDPGKDLPTGPAVLTAPEPAFWGAAKRAGFVWVREDFKMFWRRKAA